MKSSVLHRLAVKLCEGQAVFFKGHFIRAKAVHRSWRVCDECSMDSICDEDMGDLCFECDMTDDKTHILYLANKQK